MKTQTVFVYLHTLPLLGIPLPFLSFSLFKPFFFFPFLFFFFLWEFIESPPADPAFDWGATATESAPHLDQKGGREGERDLFDAT